MSLWQLIVVSLGVGLGVAALLTWGIRTLFPGRDRLLSGDGGSPALRAITATYGLIAAFVLGVSLQFFLGVQQQTSAEADTVVALSNTAKLLPPPAGPALNRDLYCYAKTVAYGEFPAMKARNYTPLDDDSALVAMYRDFQGNPLSRSSPIITADVQTTFQQLSALTSDRDARIRAAHYALPTIVWVLLIGAGAIVVLAVAAVTFVDRPWPQFFLLASLSIIIVMVLLVASALESPYDNDALSVSSGPMKAALVAVSQATPQAQCIHLNRSSHS